MPWQDGSLVSRRELLKLGAAGAAACAAGCRAKPAPRSQPQVQPRAVWKVNLGLQSYSLRAFSFEEAMAKTHQVGLHFVEFSRDHFPQNMKPQELAARQKRLAALGIQANAYGVCGIRKNEAAVRALFGFCRKAGIGTVVAAPATDALDLLDKLVEEYDLLVAIHNHGPGDKVWGRTRQLLEGTRNHNPRIGACIDTGHLIRAGDDPIEAVRTLGPRLHSLHFKDVNKHNTHDCVVGTGRTDLTAFFAALKAVAFDGALSLEYEIQPQNPIPGIAASVAAIREAVARVA